VLARASDVVDFYKNFIESRLAVGRAGMIEAMHLDAPLLESGDHLTQADYHRRYCATPDEFRAELIYGIVYVSPRRTALHAQRKALVAGWLGTYHIATPGTIGLGSTTILLPPDSEPEPDASLLIESACGGESHEEGGYLASAPELIVEVASSSVSYDLHSKFRLYEQAGVKEYIVVVLREEQVRWFAANEQGKLAEVAADDDGIFRSRVFPGLWLNANALLFDRGADLLATLQAGLATAEHAAFIETLHAKRGG
ncbi:MAG TPA: Uma2 family endonuclease, partial [Pirellulales bacterium]|nr:Uma2 family endonuclease [Pirellulales bacterium]